MCLLLSWAQIPERRVDKDGDGGGGVYVIYVQQWNRCLDIHRPPIHDEEERRDLCWIAAVDRK